MPRSLWRWVLAAEGRVLRDQGDLVAAAERFAAGGWGEGDDGPLWLWVLQGRLADARTAVESQRRAAHALASPVEVRNTDVLDALLDVEEGSAGDVVQRLAAAVDEYERLQFWHHAASAQLHLAAASYAHGDDAAGDHALAAALQFGAAQGYLNYAWWHAARMRMLLYHAGAHAIEPEYAARLLRERGLEQTAPPVATGVSPDAVPHALVVRCLGRWDVEIDGERVAAERWHGAAAGAIRMQRLLLFLARHRAPQTVEQIGRYVWPDRYDHIDVANNVHVTLSGLRRALEPDLPPGSASRLLLTTPRGYQLHPAIEVTVDLDALDALRRRAQDAIASFDEEAARAAYEQIETICVGTFVLDKPDPAEGEAYHQVVMNALCRLAEDDLARGDLDAALARAQRLVAEDRWNHHGGRLLIETYLQQGNRRAARRQYARYLKLHDEPDDAVLDLARKYRL